MSADIALITGGAVFLALIAFFQNDVERFDKEVFILFTQIVVVGKVENRAGKNFTYTETIEDIDTIVQGMNKQLTLF